MQRSVKSRFGLGLVAAAAALSLAQTAAAQGGNCITDTSPGVRSFPASQCEGIGITIAIPAKTGDRGLIAQFHGITQSEAIIDRNTNLKQLGMAAGFVVIGVNAKLEGPITRFNADDPPVIRRIVEEAIRKLNINPNRVHVSGFSQGGGVVFDFVCNSKDLIASAAAIAPAGVATPELAPDCFRDNPTAIQLTQGDRDGLVPPMQTFATRDRILAAMGVQLSQGTMIDSAEGITRTRFMQKQGSKGPRVFEFIRHNFVGASAGEGHCIPGSFETPANIKIERQGEALQIVDGFMVGCDDTDKIRSGEIQVKFFLENQRR